MEAKIKEQGPGFLGVDAFFGPGTAPADIVEWLDKNIEEGKQ
jgi:methylmalonyl-CoA mutase cobalamin-binding subunit